MNRQTRLTLFLLSCVFALKLGIVDMPVFTQHFAMVHEKLKVEKALKIEQQRETVIPPNYAVLIKSNYQSVEDRRFKENTNLVLADLVGDNRPENLTAENSQCRDP